MKNVLQYQRISATVNWMLSWGSSAPPSWGTLLSLLRGYTGVSALQLLTTLASCCNTEYKQYCSTFWQYFLWSANCLKPNSAIIIIRSTFSALPNFSVSCNWQQSKSVSHCEEEVEETPSVRSVQLVLYVMAKCATLWESVYKSLAEKLLHCFETKKCCSTACSI